MEPDIALTTLPGHPFDTAPHSKLGYGEKGRDGARGSKNDGFVSGRTCFKQWHFSTCCPQPFNDHSLV